MPNYLRTMELALELFRRQYGVAANPEDMPERWDLCRQDAETYLEEEASGNE